MQIADKRRAPVHLDAEVLEARDRPGLADDARGAAHERLVQARARRARGHVDRAKRRDDPLLPDDVRGDELEIDEVVSDERP